jgi:hypothetical protein
MSTRYLTGMLLALLGGFVLVATQAFASTPVGWIAFAVAVAAATVTVLAQLDRSRGTVQRALDAVTVTVAGLMMAFALTASGQAVIWLSFAFALGIVALAVSGLSLNEISNWRATHNLGQLHWLPKSQSTTPALDRTDSRAA